MTPTTPGGGLVEPIERWLEAHQSTGKVKFPFLDEFIAENVDIHFEAMGDAQFWMLVRCRRTGREWHLNFGAVSTRVKGYAMAEEDSGAPHTAFLGVLAGQEGDWDA